MTVKRIVSLALAALMALTLVGCAAVAPANEPEAEATEQPVDPTGSYVNAAGEAVPLKIYNTSLVLPSPLTYDSRYTMYANAFASRLTYVLEQKNGKDWSGVYSPLSLQIILQLLANGADEETSRALIDAVCSGMSRQDVNVSTAKLMNIFNNGRGVSLNNAVVASKAFQINKDYADTVGSYYNAAIGALDFLNVDDAMRAINGWVSENTGGMIDELIKDLSTDTVMVLLSTLYFDQEWEVPFIATRNLTEFFGANGTEWVSMMQRSDEFLYGSFPEGEMAVLPYKNSSYAMAVILPDKELSPAEAVKHLIGLWSDCELKSGKVSMPKVELDTELDVLELADELGISEAIRGNFNGLLAGGEAEVSAILQGAKIIVSEAGTTAAAATAAELNKGVPAPNGFELVCNRPYAMVIFNNDTGVVMFVSIVNSIGQN